MRDSEKIATLEAELAKLRKAAEALYRYDWLWAYADEPEGQTLPKTAGFRLWRDLRDALGFDHYQKWTKDKQLQAMNSTRRLP